MTLASSPDTYAMLLHHFSRYFDAVDGANFDVVVSMLESATVVVRGRRLHGADELRAIYEGSHPVPDVDGRRLCQNHMTNLVVDPVVGDDSLVRAQVYYVRFESVSGAIAATTSGRITQVIRIGRFALDVLEHRVDSDL